MRALIITALAALLCASCSPSPEPVAEKPKVAAKDKGTTYLASITVPLGADERLESFKIETWGVDVLAVCQLPPGWEITAGRGAAPSGVIAGQASHGVTWIKDMKPLENLVLVRLHGPVQQVEQRDGVTTHPATFAGAANLEMTDGNRDEALGYANVRLTPASRCP